MKALKITISIALLLCLLPLPYGYYALVRWGAMVVFSVLAYDCYKQKEEEWMVVYGALAILFQPFFKITLGRGMWNLVDMVVVGLLLWTLWRDKNKRM
jgi:hypothetical protein